MFLNSKKSKISLFIILILMNLLPFFQWLIEPGCYPAKQHQLSTYIFDSWFISNSIKTQGYISKWNPLWAEGSITLIHHPPPLGFLIPALIHLLTNIDIILIVKFFEVLIYILCPISVFFLFKNLKFSFRVSILGAFILSSLPYFGSLIIGVGRYTTYLAFFLSMFAISFFLKHINSQKGRWLILSILCLSASIASHAAQIFFVFIFPIVHILTNIKSKNSGRLVKGYLILLSLSLLINFSWILEHYFLISPFAGRTHKIISGEISMNPSFFLEPGWMILISLSIFGVYFSRKIKSSRLTLILLVTLGILALFKGFGVMELSEPQERISHYFLVFLVLYFGITLDKIFKKFSFVFIPVLIVIFIFFTIIPFNKMWYLTCLEPEVMFSPLKDLIGKISTFPSSRIMNFPFEGQYIDLIPMLTGNSIFSIAYGKAISISPTPDEIFNYANISGNNILLIQGRTEELLNLGYKIYMNEKTGIDKRYTFIGCTGRPMGCCVFRINHNETYYSPRENVILLNKVLDKIMFKTNFESPTKLVVKESYFHYWKAYVNSIEKDISETEQGYMEIDVPGGENNILFSFEYQNPFIFCLLMGVIGMGILALYFKKINKL